MFITGPQVIKQVTGEVVTAEQLGGADAHMTPLRRRAPGGGGRPRGGVPLPAAPQLHAEQQPGGPAGRSRRTATWTRTPSCATIVPAEGEAAVRRAHASSPAVVDAATSWRSSRASRPNIVIGFARILGRSVGIVANQPSYLAGALDINASNKASRFIRFCNAFNIPLVTFVDVPGFLPGVQQEYGGIIRHGAKMLFAYSATTVPKITVILRKAYGGAYLAMCGKDLGADRVYAWPTAEVAVMGAEGAAEIVFRNEIDKARGQGGAAQGADRGVPQPLRQPVRGGRPAAGGRHHRPGRHAAVPGAVARGAAHQARAAAAEEARADSAVGRASAAACGLRPADGCTAQGRRTNGWRTHDGQEDRPRDGADTATADLLARIARTRGADRAARGRARRRRVGLGGRLRRRAGRRRRAPAAAPRPRCPPAAPRRGDHARRRWLVIAAAVAAFLGERAHIRQVRLVASEAWAQQGRVSVMASHRWAVHR